MSTKTIATSSTARKVVGSLGVIGAAAAVAGMGTFGTFTDSTAPVTTTVSSGTVNIDLAAAGEAIPANVAGFVPGDSLTRAVNLVNAGTSALESVMLNTTVTNPSILTTDTVNGLKLTVRSCSVAWTEGGTPDARTYTCSGTSRLLGSVPVSSGMTLSSPASLAVGGTDHLTVDITLPSGADNTFQGKSSGLSLVFTGTQRAGTAR
ncbi:camelysin-like metallo-endopeptidase [Blastococcus colisei]|uniref:Camelysin-like metallo-endopeptidase n=1 Tax=Blastococcus colisei TaxID=1564162 RepID=A0A543PJL6_9ACTN|nr:TasA family protein [Blastococcus colisei]TQN44265.1 camelysin-like metallo-endopeptidase [Blastococcus colisei]